MSVDIEQVYIDYICNTPEKRRSLLNLNCSHVLERQEDEDEDQDRILTNYCCPHSFAPALTLSFIKADKKTRFLLSFEPRTINGLACIDSQVERAKCANFWDFVEKEPLLLGVVKDGKFLHNSKPKILDDCCEFESDNKEPDGFEDERDKIQKMRETRSKATEALRKRREARLQLQQRSGQLPKKSKLPKWAKDPSEELVFADMVPENGLGTEVIASSFGKNSGQKFLTDVLQSTSENSSKNVPGKSVSSRSITTQEPRGSKKSSDSTSSSDVTDVLQNPEFPVTPSTVIQTLDSKAYNSESELQTRAPKTAKHEECREAKTLARHQAQLKQAFTHGNRCIALRQSKNLLITDCNS